tara:strand:- start:419 stop:2299 length:1881 start_codon:yes stop_codon:yes gene_type:complete
MRDGGKVGIMANMEKGDSSEVVYKLRQNSDFEELEVGKYYHARVDRLVKYGMFVRLSKRTSGLVHESIFDREYREGEELVVQLSEIKENGDLSFSPGKLNEYRTQILGEGGEINIDQLERHIGKTVRIRGFVSQVKQTMGPITYNITDGTGVIRCVELSQLNEKSSNDVNVGNGIQIIGTMRDGKYGKQLEIDHIEKVGTEVLGRITERYEENIAKKINLNELKFLVNWPALLKLRKDIESSAEILIRAVFSGRPIIIRHHADVDGICAGFPIEKSLKSLVTKVYGDEKSQHNLIKRLSSRAPYYDMEDAVHDLNSALSSRDRHGQMLPLLLLIDNGSTEEDTPAYDYLNSYDIPILVVDHHYPNEDEVDPYLVEHVNPYLVGEDYRITTGMICAEIARMIDPDTMVKFGHFPAISGMADRSSANAMTDYYLLAQELGFEETDLYRICEALDYATYVLKRNNGEGLIEDILGVGKENRFKKVTELLSKLAKRNMKRQVETSLRHTHSEQLETGIQFNRIEIERGAYRYTYPAPGKTTSSIHDYFVEKNGTPMITVGYGPDFAILRSDGVDLDIPQMIEEIKDEIPEAGVSGGGHLVVGSMKFIPGEDIAVREVLERKMAETPIKVK